jgi:hypothetical protein
VIKQATITAARDAFELRETLSRRSSRMQQTSSCCARSCAPRYRATRDIDQVAREVLAEALKTKLSGLGVNLTKPECQEAHRARACRARRSGHERAPRLARGLGVGQRAQRVLPLRAGPVRQSPDFNAAFNRYMPRADGAAMTVLKNAAATALEDYRLPPWRARCTCRGRTPG